MGEYGWKRRVSFVLRLLVIAVLLLMIWNQIDIHNQYRQVYPNGTPYMYQDSMLVYRASPWLIIAAIISVIRQKFKSGKPAQSYAQIRRKKAEHQIWVAKIALWTITLIVWFGAWVSSVMNGEYVGKFEWYERAGHFVVNRMGDTLVLLYIIELFYHCWPELTREWTSDQPFWAKILQSIKVFVFDGISKAETTLGKIFYPVECAVVAYLLVTEMIAALSVEPVAGVYVISVYNPVAFVCGVIAEAPYESFWLVAVLLLVKYIFVEKDE